VLWHGLHVVGDLLERLGRSRGALEAKEPALEPEAMTAPLTHFAFVSFHRD
jgi:hypothetical protein